MIAVAALLALGALGAPGAPAAAHHIPQVLDTLLPWSALPGDGYLDFMTPPRPLPIAPQPGSRAMGVSGILGEEHTGFTASGGQGFGDHPYDNDLSAGDRADFDWVQEHRPDETGAGAGGSNHQGPGALGWTIGAISPSPHRSGAKPHRHSAAESPAGALPELAGAAFEGEHFNVVDVFAQIADGEDRDEGGRREAALDYELWFVDLDRGLGTPGIPTVVFVPGWSEESAADDYVARWVPATPGSWNAVVIDPPFGSGHDQITEIDAVRAAAGSGLTVSVPDPAGSAAGGD